MTPAKLLPYIAVLLIGSVIGYLIGNNAGKRANSINNMTVPSSNTAPAAPTTDIIAAPNDTTTVKTSESAPVQEKPVATVNSETLPNDKLCFSDPNDLSLQLSLFAEGIERDSVMYDNKNTAKLADCSGMFLRVASFVKSKCDRYDYPEPKTARGTRELVAWYHNKNNLILVKNNAEDAMAKRNLIKPGAVLFFGRSGQVYNDVNISVAQQNVAHMGTVTEVKKDAEGNVIGYTMFHGRSTGKIAQRSFYHSIQPPRLGYPVLGNWNQQWLAIAYIMTPKAT
ncbi:MAG: hypothetical protein SFU99_16595 [Saprospiraceae bacterium]|nr:hypothetical protein [Saprospiraceae bacterium]